MQKTTAYKNLCSTAFGNIAFRTFLVSTFIISTFLVGTFLISAFLVAPRNLFKLPKRVSLPKNITYGKIMAICDGQKRMARIVKLAGGTSPQIAKRNLLGNFYIVRRLVGA